MKEKWSFYCLLQALNYIVLPYEVLVIGFSFEQSLICRLFGSLTDLIVIFFFFESKIIWDVKKEGKNILDHFMAGIKMLVQLIPIYILKILFVNFLVIPQLDSLGIAVTIISSENIKEAILISVVGSLLIGMVYSIFREKILAIKIKRIKIFLFLLKPGSK
ncbi:MAG: hypothetical protein WC564_02045 [Patescibacteria group bacterium]|jgi:hypothetical protein